MSKTKLLEEFLMGFWGYGKLEAPIWFIGMEEGGEATDASLSKTLERWEAQNKRPTLDIAAEHAEIDFKFFTGENPPLQPTWKKLIRAALSAFNEEGYSPKLDEMREYQRDIMGRLSGDRTDNAMCLLELLPLRSPTADKWNYDQIPTASELSYLKSRDTYVEEVMPKRILKLSDLIATHKPKAVVFYGKKYSAHYKAIVGNEAMWTESEFLKSSNGNTYFYICEHPTARGATNELFHEMGVDIGKHLRLL